MKRYNFDKIPVMASGFGVYVDTKKEAWIAAYKLAKSKGYQGKLQFRDIVDYPIKENKSR